MKRIGWKIYLILFIAFLIVPIVKVSAQGPVAITISPLKSFFSIEPGQKAQGSIFITNPSTKKMRVKPRVVSFETIDDQGTLQINEGDFSDYIRLPVSVFELEPEQKREIKFDVIAPQNVNGGKYLSILFATDVIEDGAGSFFSGEVGSLVFLEILGELEKEIKIKSFEIDPINWKRLKIEVTLENTGNTHLAPFGEMKVYNWRKKQIDLIPFYFPEILPGKERTVEYEVYKNLLGKYTAELNLINDGWDLVTEKRQFWVFNKGPVVIVLCGIVVVIFIIAFFIKSYKRRNHAKKK